jgi:hypothetical protein
MKKKLLSFIIPVIMFMLIIGFTASCSSSGVSVNTQSKTDTSITTIEESSSKTEETEEVIQTTEIETTSSETKEETVKIEETYFDIPSLIGKDVYQIKEILEKDIGKPDIYNEPTEDMFGTLNWTKMIGNSKNALMFGYDFYKDGSIADNILILTGVIGEGEPVFTIQDVIRAGNLKEDDPNYTIEIHRDDEIYKNIWITMN